MAPEDAAEPIVFLHGFTHTGASWDQVVGLLRAGTRAVAPDIRGHGSASDARPVDLEHVIADLEAIAPERFTLVGYSMGGRIALHAALWPGLRERISRLILIGASPGIADPDERARRRVDDERLAAELEHETIEQFAQRWARTPVLAGQPAEVLAAVHADRLRSRPPGLADALRGLGTGALASLWERLGEIDLPTALVAGERDRKFRAIAEQMSARIDGAATALIPNSGHAAHLENPPALAALITPPQRG